MWLRRMGLGTGFVRVDFALELCEAPFGPNHPHEQSYEHYAGHSQHHARFSRPQKYRFGQEQSIHCDVKDDLETQLARTRAKRKTNCCIHSAVKIQPMTAG